MDNKTLLVIVGPTAIGKTACAIKLAKYLDTEILSLDSRQLYKEMSIGTAKPSPDELAAVPHYFINSHSINQLVSPGDFEHEALKLLDTLFQKHQVVIAVGGSGLYVDALCKGLDEMPETDLTIRNQLNEQVVHEGLEPLKQQLQTLDPECFAKIDTANTQRVVRALEMILSTGKKISDLQQGKFKERPFRILKIGLNTERSLLYERINKRVDLMLEAGLLDEVHSLMSLRHLNALKTVGYTELFDYLDGKTTLEVAVDKIKQNTRRFAKRQLTWFRKDTTTTWFQPDEELLIHKYLNEQL